MLKRVFRKIGKFLDNKVFYKSHQRKLNNTDFTIISNNCWGGIVYEYFGLRKNSPTVGSFFFAEDYVKFIKDLRRYCSLPIKIVLGKESRHADILCSIGEGDIPVGQIDDVEIVFLHYKDPEVAKEKWEKRCKRINWNNIIIKFSYMSQCKDEFVREFQKIDCKKVMFVCKKFDNMQDLIYMPSRIGDDSDIGDDTTDWKKNINIYELINAPQTGIK